MKYLNLSLKTPEANLALDEALLDHCEESGSEEVLRLWEPQDYFVVLGYSNKIMKEVNVPYCQAEGIPILRRISGGGTVLQGPGCLNYALVLDTQKEPALKSITKSNTYIMERNRTLLAKTLNKDIFIQGVTDLTLGLHKFSGNAQRRRQRYLLFHGTFLLDFDLTLIEKTLRSPSLQPAYRKNRSHKDFVINLRFPLDKVKEALIHEWHAHSPFSPDLLQRVKNLACEKYSKKEFIEKF